MDVLTLLPVALVLANCRWSGAGGSVLRASKLETPSLALLFALSLSCSATGGTSTSSRDGGGPAFNADGPAGGTDASSVDDEQDATTIDADDAGPSGPEPLPSIDGALWEFRQCEGETPMSSPSDEKFRMPNRDSIDPEFDARQARAAAEGEEGQIVVADPALQQGKVFAYDFFSPGGRDVTLHYYPYVTTRTAEQLSKERMNLTVLVDYEPVEATWTRWSDDRSTALDTALGTGISFGPPRQFELIEVTIPAEAFPQRRAYEISLGMLSVSSLLVDRHSAWRMRLYNGGYEVPSRPCANEPLDIEERTEIEFALQNGARELLLFPETIEDFWTTHGRPLEVKPGETIRFYASGFRDGKGPSAAVAVPTANGIPIGSPKWWRHGPAWVGAALPPIDTRFSFSYTVPDEPGTYDVYVLSWTDPFETGRDLDGNRINGVYFSSKPRGHSNGIRLVVPEP